MVGISIAIAAVGAAVTIGFQVDGYIKGQEQVKKQEKAQDKQAHLTKQANYRQAVNVLQAAARGVGLQDYEKHMASRDDVDSVAFKRKHKPFHTADRPAKTGPATADTKVSHAFADARSQRGNGRPT